MKKTYIYTALAALLMAVVAILFFYPDDFRGNVLQQHDIMQGLANGQEGKAFTEATGETTRWTNSLFGGMPNFQIAPTYPANKMLSWINSTYGLWLPSPANLLFSMMSGFLIMCLCLGYRWYNAMFAAFAWGLSTYFIIIIGAGHIWKFVTLAYIPPTIGGIALCYRGRYLAGSALAALAGALQLQSNHPQMSYYFLFVVAFMILAWLYSAVKNRTVRKWGIATCCTLLAGILAVAANSASLYNSWEYSKETVRGRATELTAEDGTAPASGMDRSAITAWSYGLDESFSLLIPNVKGGATIKPVAGNNTLLDVSMTDKADDIPLTMQERQFIAQFPQYFGDQPMTNGPVYVGAFVLVLAALAVLVVNTPMKWALFAASLLALLLSWGHNFPGLTNFFIDNFPGYNKFRAVSSILVVVEFCVPLLAALAIRRMIDNREDFLTRHSWALYLATGLGALVCLAGWFTPEMFGTPFSQSEQEQLTQAGFFTSPEYAHLVNAVRETRLSLVSADSVRSLVFILLGFGVVMTYLKGWIDKASIFVCALTAVAVIDLYTVNKRYVNTDNFTEPTQMAASFTPTAADRQILADTTNYRVMDVQGFSEARSSYFHKTIGGYHAAKLTRYNDLITRQISRNNMQVLNMLNAKYFLMGDSVITNPDALGNAWWVDRITYVDTPDKEMDALDTITPGRHAVSGSQFAEVLGEARVKSPGDTIYETSYAPNRLTYKARSAKGGLAVFSEIYFPWGWTATIDGKPAPIGRVDYVLRALRVPAGTHDIVFAFDPQSLKTTNTVAMISVTAIYIACAAALALWLMRRFVSSKKK